MNILYQYSLQREVILYVSILIKLNIKDIVIKNNIVLFLPIVSEIFNPSKRYI